MIQSSRNPPPNLGRGASEIDHVDLISNLCEILILVLRVRIRACVHQECHPNLGRKIPKMSRKLSKSQVHLSSGGSFLSHCSLNVHIRQEVLKLPHFTWLFEFKPFLATNLCLMVQKYSIDNDCAGPVQK